jgi:hypothetical protein
MDDPNENLPEAEELRHYDVILFSKPRFEKEARDGMEFWVCAMIEIVYPKLTLFIASSRDHPRWKLQAD